MNELYLYVTLPLYILMSVLKLYFHFPYMPLCLVHKQIPLSELLTLRYPNLSRFQSYNPKSTQFCSALQHSTTRPVRKVSSHFEYLENRSRGLDVTWQPVRGDLTAHP